VGVATMFTTCTALKIRLYLSPKSTGGVLIDPGVSLSLMGTPMAVDLFSFLSLISTITIFGLTYL
jgi:hypothetical protein